MDNAVRNPATHVAGASIVRAELSRRCDGHHRSAVSSPARRTCAFLSTRPVWKEAGEQHKAELRRNWLPFISLTLPSASSQGPER